MSDNREEALKQWYKIRDELVNDLIYAANRLDQRHINICVLRILGNTASSVGSGMLLSGLALAPFSGGTSLPLLAATGAIIGCLGNTTSIGSIVFEKVAENKELKRTKKLIDRFNVNTEIMLSREASLYWSFLKLISPCISTYTAINTCIKFFQVFDAVTDTMETAGALFTNALCTTGLAGRVFGKFALHFSLLLNVAGIALDTIDSSIAVVDIFRLKKKGSKKISDTDRPSRKLREFICKFQNLELEEIESRFLRYNACISVMNLGRFRARYSVTYQINHNKITAVATESFRRKQGLTKEFVIPKVGTCVILTIEKRRLVKWKTLLKISLEPPYFKAYKLSGGRIFSKIKEITIKNNDN